MLTADGYGIVDFLFYSIPYLLSSVMILIIGWKRSFPYVLLIIAIITTLNTDNTYDLSGAFFFCIAVSVRKNNTFNVVVANITIILLTLRSIILKDTIPGALTIILGYFALYTLFYFIIYRPQMKQEEEKKKEEEEKEKLLKNFTDQEKQLIKLLRSGETQKTAGHIMSLPSNGANDMLKKLKKESGCKTTIEFFSSL